MKNQNESLDESDFEYMQAERDVWKARYEFACADRKKLTEELNAIKRIPNIERDELIDDLRLNHEYCPKDVILKAADMLAADAQKEPIFTISGYQLREALEFLAPDGIDEQLEQEVCIQHGPERTHDEGTDPAGLYCWLEEYPEEGAIALTGKPMPSTAPAQQVAVPHGWMMQGSNQVFKGEFAELDAKSEAKRCGGTCYAYPVYLKP